MIKNFIQAVQQFLAKYPQATVLILTAVAGALSRWNIHVTETQLYAIMAAVLAIVTAAVKGSSKAVTARANAAAKPAAL